MNSHYELKDELARGGLPESERDPGQKLAWMNSLCLVFLCIGILGTRRGLIAIKPVPPLPEVIPVIVEPAVLPPQATVEKKLADDVKPDATPVAVVLPQTPNIHFSVPTIGALVVPAALAAAPPLAPMQKKTVVTPVGSVGSTGTGGERPQPPYPKIALQQAEQGTVTLTITGDVAGNVLAVMVKETSGFPILDRSTLEFIQRHWHLPAGAGNAIFETKITYKLQLD